MNLWELAGSLRYSVRADAIQPFVKAGYGWSWCRLEDVQANGVPFDPSTTDWITPGIWPNTWHIGAGFEIVPFRRIGKLPRGAELAIRFEYSRYYQGLGLDLSDVSPETLSTIFQTLDDVPIDERVTRDDLTIGLTVSF